MALEAEQRGQEVDTVGYGTHVSLISRICVLGHMQAKVEKRHAYLEPTPPGPAKSIVTMGTLIHVCFFFHFHRLFSRSSPRHMPHSVLLRPCSPFILLCTPAALHSRTHVRTSSKLISSKPPSWQVADAGHARHDTGDWGGHWHAHTHRHAHCAHGIAGHHWVEHHRVEHLVRDGWWANADEWWWSRE